MKRVLPLLLLLLPLAIPVTACGQMPPSSWEVSLTWTAPAPAGSWAGCGVGQPSCTYVISRATIAASGSTCPATTGTAYTPLNQSSPATGTVYNDTTSSGLTVCYIAQTLQGGAVSQPSNVAGPFVVPGSPLPPNVTGNLVAGLGSGPLPSAPGPQLAMAKPMLMGRVVPAK